MTPGYPVDFVVRTTSDWTEVNFSGIPVIVLEQKAVRTTPNLTINAFHISQPQPDSISTSVLYRIVIPEPLPPQFELEISKGDIGWTTATFYTSGETDPVISFYNSQSRTGDPTNKHTEIIQRNQVLECSSLETYELERPPGPKLILAFYYPWYGNPEGPSGKWLHWDPERGYSSSHKPVLGYYDSRDPETIRKHVKWAKGAGIDAFVLSWWRAGDSREDALAKLLEVCEEESFSVCFYMEKGEDLAAALRYLSKKYFELSHYLKIGGRPVVLYYERAEKELGIPSFTAIFGKLEIEGIDIFNIGDGYGVDILERFDGYHSYNPVFASNFLNLFRSASMTAHVKGKLFAATVVPGFDQTVSKEDGRFVSRVDGRLYERMWEAAIEAESDWIVVTSFNEWHEGTEIEPSEEFGTQYLGITREYSERFKN